MEKVLTLKWTEPTLFLETTFVKGIPGVYIWGFRDHQGEFLGYYVGKGVDIFSRMSQHVSNILGGCYSIFHKDSLIRFNEFKKDTANVDADQGKLYHPNFPGSLPDFVKSHDKLQPHINHMLNNLAFTYAEVGKDDLSHLGEIEKACIQSWGIENLANTRGGVTNKILLSHSDNWSRISRKMNPK